MTPRDPRSSRTVHGQVARAQRKIRARSSAQPGLMTHNKPEWGWGEGGEGKPLAAVEEGEETAYMVYHYSKAPGRT